MLRSARVGVPGCRGFLGISRTDFPAANIFPGAYYFSLIRFISATNERLPPDGAVAGGFETVPDRVWRIRIARDPDAASGSAGDTGDTG